MDSEQDGEDDAHLDNAAAAITSDRSAAGAVEDRPAFEFGEGPLAWAAKSGRRKRTNYRSTGGLQRYVALEYKRNLLESNGGVKRFHGPSRGFVAFRDIR